MRKLLLIGVLTVVSGISSGQCPFSVSMNTSGSCVGDSFTIISSNPLSQIVWYNGTLPVKTINSANTMGVTVAGGNGPGTSSNQFIDPSSVFVDGIGNIYVTDRSNERVQKWAPGATSGITVAGGNGRGSAANQFNYPCATIVDGSGNIYVSDQNNQRVQKWAPGVSEGVTVAGGNGYGNAANQFLQPSGIFIDRSGYLYVVDQGSYRVQKFPHGSTSATNGVTVAGINFGSSPSQLANPIGIYVDASGAMYITDNGNSRVQKWNPGASTGTTVAGGNGIGSNANQFNGCTGIYVDNTGNIYVADENNNRIQKWAPGATSGVTVAGGKGYGSGSANNQLDHPIGIVVDENGNMYIADYINDRVQKWPQSLKIDSTYFTSSSGTYTAVVTDNTGCSVTTNAIVINPSVTPSIIINQSQANICSGISVFTSLILNGGNAPAYNWQVNGSNMNVNTSSYTNSSLQKGDIVTCLLTSNASCATKTKVTSNSIFINTSPIVSLTINGSNCLGSGILNISTTDTISQIIWYKENNPVDTASAVDTTYKPHVAGTYTASVTNNSGCSFITNAIVIDSAYAPVTNINTSSTNICKGDTVTFIASAMNAGTAPTYQWQINNNNAGNNDSLFITSSLSNGDVITCLVSANTSCSSSVLSNNNIMMQVKSVPEISAGADKTIFLGNNIQLSPTITGDVANYLWTPSSGLDNPDIENPIASPVITTDYTLHVTSSNGCSVSDSIKVNVLTKIIVPNAFSPNGDGINDTWNISHLRDYPDCTIDVFNRNGQPVYHSEGYGKEWDGTYDNKPLPVGTYYYIINPKNNMQQLSGSVTILR